MLRSHVTAFENRASRHPDTLAFKIPILETLNDDQTTVDGQPKVREWIAVSYRQFWLDIESCARKWSRVLRSELNIPRKSVIGLWLQGSQYTDVVHVYAISRAGYIPQLISFLLPDPIAVYNILAQGNAKALICAPSLRSALKESLTPGDPLSSIPVRVTFDWAAGVDAVSETLPDLREESSSPEEIVMILHTSGSTSGMPKVIPLSYRWLESCIRKAVEYCNLEERHEQVVSTWLGSICHGGQHLMMMNHALGGACVVQPTRLNYSSSELKDMIQLCGVNRIQIFPSYLSVHLRNSRTDTKLLELLKGVNLIEYSGLAVGSDDKEWVMRNGLKLRGLFGSTECGMQLHTAISHTADAYLFRPFKSGEYAFLPTSVSSTTSSSSSNSNTEKENLLELVVLSSSSDWTPAQGEESAPEGNRNTHTGDLFEEVQPGLYASRGRNDDFIKLAHASRCNTREIEDTIRSTCGDLIERCVVVGSLRPSIALVVETKPKQPLATTAGNSTGAEDGSDELELNLKKEIIKRIKPHNTKSLIHERITDPKMILVVPSGTLPRTATKGNVRRQMVEELYKERLDSIYK